MTLNSPHDAYLFLRELEGLDRETFWRVDLDARNRVVACEEVSRGHLTASIVHPREVYKGAILSSAASILVAHNHPSGDPTPSVEDQALTRRLQEAGALIGIPLVDHLILGNRCYTNAANDWSETAVPQS